MPRHKDFWDRFCTRMQIYESGVPLFSYDENLVVPTKVIGVKAKRLVLCRNPKMDRMILSETDKLILDWKLHTDLLDGLIYVMFLKESGSVLPLYIGKAETIGKGERNLSANITNLHLDKTKFARWGDNYAYHIGDLSAAVLPGHRGGRSTEKYRNWATVLFEEFPTEKPKLKQQTFFWATAWRKDNVGIWEGFGSTRLTFLEYLMIGVASSAFPGMLLNREGQNRG